MTKSALNLILLSAILIFGAAFYKSTSPNVKQIAQIYKLDAAETNAFLACHKQTEGKGLETRNPHGTIKRYTIPDEICVCQARAMAATFKPDRFDEHRIVIDYRIAGAAFQPLPPAALKLPPVRIGDTARALAKHLTDCIDEFQRAQEAKTEAFKQILIQKQHDAKL